MPPTASQVGAGLLAMLAVGCGFDQIDKPPPPDTEPLYATLANPDGRFADGDSASQVFSALAENFEVVKQLCGVQPVREPACLLERECRRCALLQRLGGAIKGVVESIGQANDTPDAGSDRRTIPGLRGLLDLDILCDGFEVPRVADPDNGRMTGTLGFTSRGIDPVVWGELENCAKTLQGTRVRLTGSYVLSFDAEAVRASDYESTPLLMAFDGTLEDVAAGQSFDAHVLVQQRLDGQGPLILGAGRGDDGTFVVRASQNAAELEGAGGVFACDPEEQRCVLQEEP